MKKYYVIEFPISAHDPIGREPSAISKHHKTAQDAEKANKIPGGYIYEVYVLPNNKHIITRVIHDASAPVKKWILTASNDGINVNHETIIESEAEPDFWTCYVLADAAGCTLWSIDELEE